MGKKALSAHKRRLNEIYERILRYVEELDAIRERAQIVKEELATIISDKMNRNMYIISTIAAIFLPLTFFYRASWNQCWRNTGRGL